MPDWLVVEWLLPIAFAVPVGLLIVAAAEIGRRVNPSREDSADAERD